MLNKIKIYYQLSRPYTLLAPALGILSGSFVALGSFSYDLKDGYLWMKIALGVLVAAILNAASNAFNQIYDLEIDRRNKPERPLPSGKITVSSVWMFSVVMYGLAIAISFIASNQFALMVGIAAFCTIIYSAPPRTKRHWLAAALTIAIPRGMLLKVAGWAVLQDIYYWEPWYIGAIFGLFLLGATTTKDYADIAGDHEQGCTTLPIRFGIKESAWMISPFFIFPFLLFPLGVYWEILQGNAFLLHFLGISLCLWGSYVVYLILKNPDSLSTVENHPSWKHMYLMMMYSQVLLALAYMI